MSSHFSTSVFITGTHIDNSYKKKRELLQNNSKCKELILFMSTYYHEWYVMDDKCISAVQYITILYYYLD